VDKGDLSGEGDKSQDSRHRVSRTDFLGVLPGSYLMNDSGRLAGLSNGGIDLNPEKLRFDSEGDQNDINFDIDPAQLQQMQNATGFLPVIIGIQPINSLNGFLGLADQPAGGIKPGYGTNLS